MIKNRYRVIGVMSGTSLDGIDLCYVEFRFDNHWQFTILESITYPYSLSWQKDLKTLIFKSDSELDIIDKSYTKYTADFINQFISDFNISEVDFVSSHGHTAKHQPEASYTYQIGNRPELSSYLNIKVVCDFRTQDVVFGGQGAPLVPIGDQLLFHSYDACLNLGGFANVSFNINEERIAFDICPFNFVLNDLSNQLDLDYDKGGHLARSGSCNTGLLNKLNAISYYREAYPKSLGAEWVQDVFYPVLNTFDIPVKEKLHTCVLHFVNQINNQLISDNQTNSVLVTGGGALNTFFIEQLNHRAPFKIVVPEKQLIDFKEAIVFAFLGVLRIRNEVNCLKSVTGATKDHSSGKIYYPKIS